MPQLLVETGTTVADFGSTVNESLMTNVNPNSLATQYVQILPWIGLIVVVSFVIYKVGKAIKGASKGKVRV